MREIKKEKMPVGALTIGMYVCELDRPWSSTSFAMQGFYIRSVGEIDRLQELCQYVYIDVRLTLEWEAKQKLLTSNGAVQERKLNPNSGFSLFDRKRIKRATYENTTGLREELPVAGKALEELIKAHSVFCQYIKQPNDVHARMLKSAASAVIESVIRNPGAMLWHCAVTECGDRLLNHAMRCMVFAAVLARRMGLVENEVKTVAFGALLMDIGKVLYPKTLTNMNRPLTDDEYQHLQGHVQKSLKIVSAYKLLSNTELKVIEHHHEKFDGTGYPAGLEGNSISLHARIAAIVDHYSAIITDRPTNKPISPAEAQNKIYKLKNVEVQAELIAEFIQAIGVYPAASLVELHSGEIATVLMANSKNKLRPVILIMLDENKNKLQKYEAIDLSKDTEKVEAQLRTIKRGLEHGAHGISMRELRDIKVDSFLKASGVEKRSFWGRRKLS